MARFSWSIVTIGLFVITSSATALSQNVTTVLESEATPNQRETFASAVENNRTAFSNATGKEHKDPEVKRPDSRAEGERHISPPSKDGKYASEERNTTTRSPESSVLSADHIGSTKETSEYKNLVSLPFNNSEVATKKNESGMNSDPEDQDHRTSVSAKLYDEKPGNQNSPPSSSSFLLSVNLCSCDNDETTGFCLCPGPGGLIRSRNGLNGSFVYNINLQQGEKALIYFPKNETDFSASDSCSLTIGDKLFNNETVILEHNIITAWKSLNITETNTDQCYWSVLFRISAPHNESSRETAAQGTLTVPSDPDKLQMYRPMTRRLWNIVPDDPSCSLKITVIGLDLGSTSAHWDGSPGKNNDTMADFLVIGAGESSINVSVSVHDTVLYGRSESPLVFAFDQCAAHVTFVSDMHYQNASGFTIKYEVAAAKAKKNVTEEKNVPFALNLNGVSMTSHLGLKNISLKFQESVSIIAKRFLMKNRYGGIDPNVSISFDEVTVQHIGVCDSVYCADICSTFIFSMNSRLGNGSWVFSTQALKEMFRDEDLEDSWTFEECEVCLVEDDTGWRWMGVGAIIALMIVIVIVSLIYKVKEAVDHASKRRSRNPNDLSHLTISSSSVSQRFSLPLSRRTDDNSKEPPGWFLWSSCLTVAMAGEKNYVAALTFKHNDPLSMRVVPGTGHSRFLDRQCPAAYLLKKINVYVIEIIQNYNISGFEQFDPVGERVDPRACGLDEEVVHDRHSVTFYSNSAFEGDEHELFSQVVLRKPQVGGDPRTEEGGGRGNCAQSGYQNTVSDSEESDVEECNDSYHRNSVEGAYR